MLHDQTSIHPKQPTPRDIVNLGKCVHRSLPLQCWQEGTGSRWKQTVLLDNIEEAAWVDTNLAKLIMSRVDGVLPGIEA